jgi:hypothetical protein
VQLYGTADYLNGETSSSELLGMNPAQQSRAAGDSTPLTTAVHGDRSMVPWSADSPGFWLAVIAGATLIGIVAADVRVRFGKREARASVGKT